jgi:hypothetical protein
MQDYRGEVRGGRRETEVEKMSPTFRQKNGDKYKDKSVPV